MTETSSVQPRDQLANRVGVLLSALAGILWVVYGMTGANHVLLIVAIVYSMLVGLYWAFGRDWVGKTR